MTNSRFQTGRDPDVSQERDSNHRIREIHEELREESTMGFERRIQRRGYILPYEGSAEERYRNR